MAARRTEARRVRRTPWVGLPPLAVWLCRLQALALVGGAIALLVLSATSDVSTGAGFLAVDVIVALAVATLLATVPKRPWARTPILLTELIAVLVSTQLWSADRHAVALAVGIPALVLVVTVVAASRAPRDGGR
ncbi:MAG TPA: hypothetical protein VHC41_09440 [Mycobacteriales bacterium]|nr:hypothetical protein [Mycobacteriales bacterium]